MTSILTRRDLLGLGALLSLAACAPRRLASEGIGTGGTEGYFDGRLVVPEAVGMSREGIAGIRAAIQKNIDAKVIAGAVTAVARHTKLVLLEAQGLADVAAGTPMTTNSLFRMMSSSKVVTAVAVLMMMEEGKLALDDSVSKFIPSFKGQRVATGKPGNTDPSKLSFAPASRDITIRDLLTHTSGLSSFEGLGPGPGALVNKLDRSPSDSLSNVIPKFGDFVLDFEPGTKFRYSPLDGFDTLLYLVELVSGTPAERFVTERIFEPLDMRQSFFNVPPSEKSRKVKIYSAKEGQFTVEKPIFGEMFGDGPFTYISGAGGIISTARDFLNFEIMLLNRGSFNGRRLLRPDTVALMARNHVGNLFADWIPFITGGNGFGLGVRVLQDEAKGDGARAGAFGWGGAYGTESWADPQLDVAAVMLIQMNPAPRGPRADFSAAIRKAIVA